MFSGRVSNLLFGVLIFLSLDCTCFFLVGNSLSILAQFYFGNCQIFSNFNFNVTCIGKWKLQSTSLITKFTEVRPGKKVTHLPSGQRPFSP